MIKGFGLMLCALNLTLISITCWLEHGVITPYLQGGINTLWFSLIIVNFIGCFVFIINIVDDL